MKKIEEKKANQWFTATTIDPFQPILMVPMKVTTVVLPRSTRTHSSNDQERNAMRSEKVGRYFALGRYFAHWKLGILTIPALFASLITTKQSNTRHIQANAHK
jgi:hypothetical protein